MKDIPDIICGLGILLTPFLFISMIIFGCVREQELNKECSFKCGKYMHHIKSSKCYCDERKVSPK